MIGRKTLGDILSSFTKTIQHLKDLEDYNSKKVGENTTRIEVLVQHNDELTTEARSAKVVRDKIENLIAA